MRSLYQSDSKENVWLKAQARKFIFWSKRKKTGTTCWARLSWITTRGVTWLAHKSACRTEGKGTSSIWMTNIPVTKWVYVHMYSIMSVYIFLVCLLDSLFIIFTICFPIFLQAHISREREQDPVTSHYYESKFYKAFVPALRHKTLPECLCFFVNLFHN